MQSPDAVQIATQQLRRGERVGIGRVEGLHASHAIAVERCRRTAVGAEAKIVVRRVCKPYADSIQLLAHTCTVDDRRGEGLAHDQFEGAVPVSLRVGAHVTDILGGAERRFGLLQQENRGAPVGRQVARPMSKLSEPFLSVVGFW